MSEQVYTLKDSILKLESDISDKVFSNQASQAVGFAAGGLRTTVLFSERAENLLSSIRKAADLHLPIVFWVPENIQDMISGAIIWSLVDEEQLMATALMAHRSAELALMPAVIMYPHALKIDSLLDFNKNTALQFLKTSAAAEKSPTPAQEFLFGENRPLNINWIDLNHPRLLNPVQNSKERYLRWASENTFFRSHVPEILDSVRKEYNKAFIEPFEWFDFVPGKKSKSVIYCSDSTFSEIKEVQVSNQGASTYPGILHAKLVSPFPSEDFARLLPPSSEVSWAMKQGNRVNNLQNSPPFTRMGSNWHKIVLNDEVLSEGKDAMDSLLEAASKGDLSEVNFSGVTFTGIETGQPRKEILIDFIKEHYPHYAEKKKNRETKHVFSVFSSESPRLRKLNIEQKGVLGLADYIPYILEDYDEKGLAQNWAHPLRAINSTPGAASLASDWSDSRQQFPVWSPSACTTCGSCFDQCPVAALTPASFNWESFLTSAQVLCDEKGFNVSKIRPLIKPLASALSTVTASAEGNISEYRVSDFLPNALEQVFEKMQPEDQKKKEIEEAVGYILAEVGTLKVAVGELFFNELESYQKGTGELLHIEFDPHACTGCGLCAESCNENAIVMTSVEELRELDLASFPHVEKFQNTQSDTLEYLLKSPEISPFQALRLKRGYARNTIARGKSNSDLYKAITDVLLMAKLKAEKQTLNYITSVKSSVEDLQEHIHDLLGQAIPDRDFSSVHDTVKRNNGHRISVGELIGTGAHASLNSRELKRKLDLLEKLTQLRDHLEQGYSGGVRVGLALMIFENPYLNGLCNYPENPFDIPAWSQGDIKTAFGVQEALFLNYLEELKLLKRAALEVKGKYHPAVHEQELSELTWNSLSDEEKENIPSVIALGGWEDSGVSEDYISAYSLPMKVVLFEDFSRITPKKGYKAIDFARNTGWSVWQGVQGHENIKYRQLTEFFNQKGPGLYSFLTLEKELWAARETLKERGFIAVASRAWPIIKASTGQGLAFPKIRLEGNPQIKENLVVVRSGDEIEEKKEYTLTWADLVVRMISRKGELEPLEDGGENATPASVVINGQINESGGAVMNPAGKNLWVQPTSGIIEESKQVLGNWQALKQYAGYSETASEEVKEEIKSIFEKELNEEKRKIQKLYDEKATAQKGEIKKLLKEKLVALALKRK